MERGLRADLSAGARPARALSAGGGEEAGPAPAAGVAAPVAAPEAGARRFLRPPSLTLYVHVPWCVRKCPYCDFNSHRQRGPLPAARYVDRLLDDLEADVRRFGTARALQAIFIGGGTPSLMPGAEVQRLLDGVRARIPVRAGAEITLEANPGTVDAAHFEGYAAAGVNRLSIGVQSFDAARLRALGRIHGPDEALAAVAAARAAGLGDINLDLMFALPGQDAAGAGRDLEAALALAPAHLSYYQLTLEPGTAFHRAPPALPDGDLAADLHQQGLEMLAAAGYRRYEVSAFARPGRHCRHNLNYWRFGDYLGIGAGAHGKVTDACSGRVLRYAKERLPSRYLGGGAPLEAWRALTDDDLLAEFALNALRLVGGFRPALFTASTGLPTARLAPAVERARGLGLLEPRSGWLRASAQGMRFLDDLVGLFAPV